MDAGPKTRADLDKLLQEGAVESTQLEFKSSKALGKGGKEIRDLCINVSAMANSAGGRIIYCLDEQKKSNGPTVVDDGVEGTITRDWIGQILNSHIQPRLSSYQIDAIDLGQGRNGFIITVPQSHTAHQAPDKLYYKRFELEVRAMEDYELRDVLRRSTTPAPFVTLAFPTGNQQRYNFRSEVEESDPFQIYTRISNRSAQPAYYTVVDIGFDKDLQVWGHGDYQPLGEFHDNSGLLMNWFRNQVVSPPGMPIFKEHTMMLGNSALSFYFGSSALHAPYFDITVMISAPGFTSEEHWAIGIRGSTLHMHPPGSEMTDRSSG
jgi:hypothetical protein